MRSKNTVMSMLLLFVITLVTGQELERRAMFGVAVGPLSEANIEGDVDRGVYIQGVRPGFTFEKMGIQEGSILLSINGQETYDLNSFRSVTSAIRGGADLEVAVNENGEVRRYKGKAMARPFEEHPQADLHYEVVSYPGNNLRSILYTPKGKENAPVVFYLQGYTCQSVEYPDFVPMKKLINEWITAGYAVYMVEKPGMGDSDCETGCMDITFHQELEAFSQAYSTLLQDARIDKDNIFLFGHSLGGIVAPILAQQVSPKGVIVYGTVGKNWCDYMKDVVTEQQMMFGSTKEQVVEASKQSFPFIEDLMVSDLSNTEMVNSGRYTEYLSREGLKAELERGYYLGRHYKFWRSLADIDIPNAWKQVTTNVNVMHGEYDIQAINAKYARMIADLVNDHQGKAIFELVPDTDHAFLKFESMEQNIRALTNGTYSQALREKYNPEVAQRSIVWMNSLVRG
ncbi:CocE/NonD family hydrolase [Robertkochia sediminum]|uniref:CocE/NonD family hydrolase n=1 Tax=Robertkochia sediminum TaxID=2785326 RepID=UPI0019342303|nr:CocE/NonD family hydrolase [Robertkochia sediminum]MBL7472929.1 alpha/beta fold hydrolase [Robertkochia sediminum]